MISYGLDFGELIQQYIWLFCPVHTYNSALAGKPSPGAPSFNALGHYILDLGDLGLTRGR